VVKGQKAEGRENTASSYTLQAASKYSQKLKRQKAEGRENTASSCKPQAASKYRAESRKVKAKKPKAQR